MSTLGREELEALAEKYREMIALRAERGPRDALRLRRLAARFPGALRELDTRTDASLADRLASIERALGGAEAPAWAAVQLAFHGWMRLALALRAAGARDLVAARAYVASYARALPGDPSRDVLDDPTLETLVRPPAGRLSRAARSLVDAGARDLDALLFGASARERERG
ncbi:MAG: hypothetical protein U0234_32665 [Sandaracinus sp.]